MFKQFPVLPHSSPGQPVHLEQLQRELCGKKSLVLCSYSDQTADWQQLPFPEEVDLACSDPYIYQI